MNNAKTNFMSRENDIRKEILLQTYALRPLAVSAERIQRDARKNGYDYTVAEVKREADFLRGDGQLEVIQARGTTEQLFKITADGVRNYEQN